MKASSLQNMQLLHILKQRRAMRSILSFLFIVTYASAYIRSAFQQRQRSHTHAETFPLNACKLRFLESNSWEMDMDKVKIYIDPVMSQLDFGVPFLYTGNKKKIDGEVELQKIADNADLVLISQGFDDHAHAPTLKRLARLNNKLRYLCPPRAESILLSCDIPAAQVEIIRPGEQYSFTKGATTVAIRATSGALLGPPWQQKENGYIIDAGKKNPKVYFEPHGMWDRAELSQLQADVVISPVVSQLIGPYTLLSGGSNVLQLADALKAKTIVPMANGALEQKGPLARIVLPFGSVDKFKRMASKRSKGKLEVRDAFPGDTLLIAA